MEWGGGEGMGEFQSIVEPEPHPPLTPIMRKDTSGIPLF